MTRPRSFRAYAEAYVALASELSSQQLPALAKSFVRLLARDRLLHRAEAVLDTIDELLIERDGALRADVRVATRDALEQKTAMERLLAQVVGQPVQARMAVDERLIAGFRARVEDLSIDASLRGALTRLRHHLRSA